MCLRVVWRGGHDGVCSGDMDLHVFVSMRWIEIGRHGAPDRFWHTCHTIHATYTRLSKP